jgi:DNA helicase-2/ATP-dependent DNA helicase PcrA
MSNDLMKDLNKEQLEAVMHKDGPLLILAGAGTGKTTVITQRIAYLIEQNLAKPEEILALTFTEKAAGEMEERVDRLLPFGYLDLWISTFHSFGEKLLNAHGLEIGLSTDFKLLNEFEQYLLVKKNLEKFDLEYYKPMGNPTKFIRALIKHFSRCKDEDISPKEYLEYANDIREDLDSMLGGAKKSKVKSQKSKVMNIENNEIALQEINRVNEVANAYHVYQQLLLDNSALDFGDLINYCLKLFRERPAILEKYRQQFKYILLDEFQDTNLAQYELIKMLAAPRNNLVVVGDDDQSIYKFRGASVSNILQFKKDFPKAKELVLVNNYRNKQDILDLSYNFIQLNNPDRLEVKLSAGKKKLVKKLNSQTGKEGVIKAITGADLQDEVRKVVEEITDLKINNKNSSWSDFAILVRANDSAGEFCSALDEAGFPYQFLSSRGLYSKPIILNIIAYLKLLDNYHESIALYRVLNMPIFNFNYQELVNLNYVANKKAWSLFTVLKDANGKFGREVQGKIDKILNLISRHTTLTRDKNVSEVFLSFVNDSGYLKYLSALEEGQSIENINLLNKFLKRIKTFEAGSDDKSVKAFINELSDEIDAGEQGSLPFDVESGPEAIKIMTIHSAKGLEFKYVFIPNMVDKRFPTIERKEPIVIPDPLIKETLPEGDAHLQEERRLFYVAVTRAKENLCFSWAKDYGGARDKKPSRFLLETDLVKGEKNKLAKKSEENNNDLALKTSKISAEEKACINIPNYFSYTQLAAFSNCPYQYRFAHILKIPRTGKAAFSFGKTMHSTMQKTFELVQARRKTKQTDLFGADEKTKSDNPKISLDEMIALYNESWIDEWYQDSKQKEEYKKRGRQSIKEFYEKNKDNWPMAEMLEKGFHIKITVDKKLYTIRGAIDRVDSVGDKIKIVDYKTGAPKEKLTFDEKEQLLLYQLASSQIFDKEVSGLCFYYFDNNSEIEFLGTAKELDKIQDKIINTIRDINKCEFPANPGPLCAFCDFRDICEFKKI